MLRFIRCALAASLLGSTAPALAQQAGGQNQAQGTAPTSQQLRQFTGTFQNGVAKGCLSNPPQGLRNPAGYCNCYANSFVNRYQAQELLTISRMASSPQAPNLIAVMMSPEIRACRQQFQ